MKIRIYITITLTTLLTASFGQLKKEEENSFAKSIDSLILTVNTPFNRNVLRSFNNHIILSKNYGYSNFESKEKLNDSSMFDLPSVSKQFTAMGIMILKERCALSYNDGGLNCFSNG